MTHDPTDQALAEMLTEDTGRQMCDSGDYYGRNHEAQKGKAAADFVRGPASSYEVMVPRNGKTTGVEINAVFDLFHWLRQRLTITEVLTDELWKFGETEENQHESWFSIVEAWLKKRKAEGPSGWGDEPITVNTYNHGGSCLSQVIQFTTFALPEDDAATYLALFIHGGCDVRGGYTKPRIFQLIAHKSYSDMYDDDRYQIEAFGEYPNGDKIRSSWDEHGHFDRGGDVKPDHIPDEEWTKDLKEFPFKIGAPDDIAKRGGGIIYVSEDMKGATCPFSGVWLEVWPYGDF